MYEASFGLKRRPFAATPDATCFLQSGTIQGTLDELIVCVEHGQGIAVLTAPAGTGKTLLCERLRFELDERYETVFLRHASFLTRRALLQTILCELNHAFHHPSEQELRLELFPAIRALQPKREALVLICDEAHQLTDSLLEELRILADFAESGRPLVRLVLVGQLSLEEKLAQPSLEAFNQRIRAHVSLSSFDLAGSIDYIDYRLTWAGGRTEEVFTPSALNLIAHASDGVPRCINQLADHTLLLAFVSEQRPAGEELVREALGDLRQLPLHWNELPQSLSSSEHLAQFTQMPIDEDSPRLSSVSAYDSSGYLEAPSSGAAIYSFEPDSDSESDTLDLGSISVDTISVNMTTPEETTASEEVAYETPHDFAAFDHTGSTNLPSLEVGSDDWRQTLDLFHPRTADVNLVDRLTELVSETINAEPIDNTSFDSSRQFQLHDLLHEAYAAAGASPTSTSDTLEEEIIVDRYATIDAGFEPPPASLTDTINRREVRVEQIQIDQPSTESILEAIQREVVELTTTVRQEAMPQPLVPDSESAWESIETDAPEMEVESRPFRYLFSKLRRKQQGLA